MNPTAIAQLQKSLGLPATGVLDSATFNAMSGAVTKSIATNPDVKAYSGGSTPDTILNAYMTGNWSGVTDLTGKPFTDDQQKAAVDAASSALAPGFDATAAYDKSKVESDLNKDASTYSAFQKSDAEQFGKDKNILDKSAADNGVLFSGARAQKNSQLAGDYAARDASARNTAVNSETSTARDYAYQYGSPSAQNLKSLYSLPTGSTFNANVAGGKVTPGNGLSAAYDPNEYGYQGTKRVANNAAVQTRAASLLGNRANKLSLAGYSNKY